ncbi:hypothetical protein CfE428DRAFT_3382 [Chthoniobacter flavus Ellin428]|uniref:Calcineurin-like phosphoesterase domain-containing protein n=1 Tax=Chthoniobacter flavus Ellin428 TaxID=497964 RepID=B4D394_9BACT|nr:hypothetical protein [Chthoniobacter flavus]EDY19205.1 hypothetical protein CfE428DRAFT_3382 [Chthoniobacter flavus Ellin428]TCO88049.1 hypothetical protein EV701_11993 [Chthoniobacter flavus]
MRIHVLSDLHQEFGEVDVPDVDCDCVILAGDVSTKEQGLMWIRSRFRDVPVIHHRNDYRIGRTRILANPRAYPDDPNEDFIPDLVVEVEGEAASRL